MTVNIENIVGAQQMGQSSIRPSKDLVPTRDQAPPPAPSKKM